VAALTLSPLLSLPCCCECAQDHATPLHGAAHNGHDACVTLLVERCANTAAKNEVRCADARATPCCADAATLLSVAVLFCYGCE
jgi:ankyrin repeat protein